jgi:DNA-binding MarR family transcriptional regulator
MKSTNNVHNTRISGELSTLHGALLDIVSAMNRPQRDEILIRKAGIPLDRALFPLLVGIDRFAPIGVVEAADRVGRDYTTVSRQFAKLESLGLIERQSSKQDKRVREAFITPQGKEMVKLVDEAREKIALTIFEDWDPAEFSMLVQLMRKFADSFGNDGKLPKD